MPPNPPRTFRLPTWLGVLAIFGLAFAAFWPSVGGAILWDDPAHITLPEYQSGAGWWRMVSHLGVTQEYYPGLFSAFWLEHHLWREWLPGYHLLNIALHAGSACLLALILCRLWTLGSGVAPGRITTPEPNTERLGAAALPGPGMALAAWFAGALFAVHPVAVESVAWMTEQKNTLSLFFYLLAALLYLRFDEGRRPVIYVVATLVFVLALSAKTATFTLPPALLVVAWWQCGRIDWRRDVFPLLPWFALAVLAGLLTVHVETNFVGAKGESYALPFGQRLLLAPRIVWFYVAKDLWPMGVLFFYPRWNVAAEASKWWPYAVGVLGVTVALWAVRRRARGPLTGWLLFLGAMFPVIGFFNVYAFLFSYVADHFQYMPCLMLVATVTGIIAHAAASRPGPALARIAGSIGLLAVTLCAVETHCVSALYRDNETLFAHVVSENPSSWMAHQILASALGKSGRDDEAADHYREVIRLKPDYPDAYLGLGAILAKKAETRAEAIRLYERAVELRPHYVEAHYALGLALADNPARRDEAIRHLETALSLQPHFIPAELGLGGVLAKDRARLPEALEHFRTALLQQPANAAAHRGYADALARSGAFANAVEEYQAALQLAPADAIAHFHLADVLARLPGRQPEAKTHYEAALKADPTLADAHLHYAGLLAQEPGRMEEASRHVARAVELDPNNADAHNTLGIIFVQQGDAVRARQEWEAALRIDPNHRDARANLQRLDQMTR